MYYNYVILHKIKKRLRTKIYVNIIVLCDFYITKEMVIMDKIFKSLNSINSFSRKIIFYGCLIVLAFCIVGAGIIAYNSLVTREVSLYELGSSMIHTSTVMFAQVVIGALVIDWFNTMIQNND